MKAKTFPLAVHEDDRILFGKYSGTEIKIDGEDFIIMKKTKSSAFSAEPPPPTAAARKKPQARASSWLGLRRSGFSNSSGAFQLAAIQFRGHSPSANDSGMQCFCRSPIAEARSPR